MTPTELLRNLERGALAPVTLITGREHYLRDRLLAKFGEVAVDPAMAAFNADRFIAGEHSVDTVLAAANLLPMMSERRFVLVKQVERWEGKGDDTKQAPIDRLAAYAAEPNPSTVLVLVAEDLDGRRRFAKEAKKAGIWVTCEPLAERELAGFVITEARARGHEIDEETAGLLAQLAGPELFQLADAVERLSLYVGKGAPIDDEAVSHTITRLRVEDSWALVDALRARDPVRALAILGRVYDPRDRGLPLLGAMAWSVRQLLRLQSNLADGVRFDEAARRAGLFNPGRARELARSLEGARPFELERMLETLAETDLALKGSKREPLRVLEAAVLRLCRG